MLDVPAFQTAIGDNYTIDREIGRGGMARVFVAHDRKHDRRVAIKVLSDELDTLSSAERFQREIRLLARLQHPNILPVLDSGVADERLWYAMPFVEGESLRASLQRQGPFEIAKAVSMLASIADALNYAHACGVVHRDIKPENILLSHSIPLVADFGIAAALDATSDNRLTQTGLTVGTPLYMSPEQALGERAVDGRSDIYSLGCVGFEIISGNPPFGGANVQAVIAHKIAGRCPSLSSARPEVSRELDAVLAKAIARDPAERWQTGDDFSRALSGALTHRSSGSRRLSLQRLSKWQKAGMAIAGLALFAVSGDQIARRSDRQPEVAKPAGQPDTAAVSAYRRGMARVQQRTQRTLTEGLALIDESIRRDSSYALAWAGRAHAFNWARQWGFEVPGISSDSLLTLALQASERALDLDSTDANIWLVSAIMSRAVDPSRRDLSQRAVRRAIHLDSMNAGAWMQRGHDYQDLGYMDSARSSMRRAMLLSGGRTGAAGYANHFYWRREYDSAAVWSDSAIRHMPRLPYSWEMAGATAIMRGKLDDAQTYYEAALRLDKGPTRVRALEGLSETAALRGDTAGAKAFIAEAEQLADREDPDSHAAISLASAYATLGNNERALRWLESVQSKQNLHFQLHVQRDPLLDPLRKNPRFAAIAIKPVIGRTP